ncbi:MAG: glycosyltransferase family 4 protein [bacterium]
MKRLRICFVAQTMFPLLDPRGRLPDIGGAELQQLLLGRELANRGHEVSYITMDYGQEEIETIGPFTVISTFKPKEGIRGLRFVYPRLLKIWRALKRSEADIYYVRCANFILAPVVWFARRHRKKVVFCGASDPDFDPQRVTVPILRDRILYFWGLKRCDAIIVQNEVQQKLLQKHFRREATIIHNGLQKADTSSQAKGEILWVGNFKWYKRPRLFIELARKIPHERFVMIGGSSMNGSQKLYHSLAEQARQVPNLQMRGFLPFEEVEKAFGRAKLFVNTSEHEGFPNTFLQAWSKGIPVISFVDPDDLIQKNHLGLVVKDLEEMAQKTQEVAENRIEFSPEQIRQYFEANLTLEKMVDRYESLLHSLNGKR